MRQEGCSKIHVKRDAGSTEKRCIKTPAINIWPVNATGHLFRPVLVLHTAVHSSDWWHCSVEQCCTDGRCCQGSTMVKVLSDCLPVEAIFSHFPNDALNYYWHYYDSYNELNLLHYSFMSHNQHLQHVWECVSAHTTKWGKTEGGYFWWFDFKRRV